MGLFRQFYPQLSRIGWAGPDSTRVPKQLQLFWYLRFIPDVLVDQIVGQNEKKMPKVDESKNLVEIMSYIHFVKWLPIL